MIPGSLLEHLEALRGTLWRSIAAIALLLVPGFWLAPRVLKWIIAVTVPAGMKLHYFTPMEPFFCQLNLGLFLAFLGASPYVFHQLVTFISPGLHPRERAWTGRFLAAAVVLFLAGAALAFWGVVPLVMRFSLSFADTGLAPMIGLGHFLHLTLLLVLGFALIFQLPVVLLLLVAAGVVEPKTLGRCRPAAVVVIFLAAGLLTPPDVLSQLMMALPAWLLFECALLIAPRLAPKETPAEEENARPAPSSEDRKKAGDDDVYEDLPPEYRPYRQKRRIRPL